MTGSQRPFYQGLVFKLKTCLQQEKVDCIKLLRNCHAIDLSVRASSILYQTWFHLENHYSSNFSVPFFFPWRNEMFLSVLPTIAIAYFGINLAGWLAYLPIGITQFLHLYQTVLRADNRQKVCHFHQSGKTFIVYLYSPDVRAYLFPTDWAYIPRICLFSSSHCHILPIL